MLQARNPEKVYPSPLEEKMMSKVERRGKNNLRATAILALATTGLGLYWSDVNAHEQVEAAASSHINMLSGPKNAINDDSALVFFNGFGTYDANVPAEHLGPVIQQTVDGEIWSESYSNAPINYETMSEQIIDLAHKRNIDKISIIGYSAGGDIGAHVAANIAQHSNLQLQLFEPISTPNGTEGLRPARLAEVEMAKLVTKIPGAQYSTLVRFIGEMYFRRDQFNKGSLGDMVTHFFATAGNVNHDLNDKKLPGTWLLIDQTLAIADADMEENIKAMANTDSHHLKPVIEYLGTAKPGYDYMVNNLQSSKDICSYAGKAGLSCFVFNVPGAIHTRPDLDTDEYMKTVKAALPLVQAALKREASAYSIENEKIITRVVG